MDRYQSLKYFQSNVLDFGTKYTYILGISMIFRGWGGLWQDLGVGWGGPDPKEKSFNRL